MRNQRFWFRPKTRAFVALVAAGSSLAWAFQVMTVDFEVGQRAEMLRSRDRNERLSGLLDLTILVASSSSHARPALPLVLHALEDKDPEVRAQALISLSDLAGHTRVLGLDPSVYALARRLTLEYLDDESPEVRAAAIGSLGRLGPIQGTALPLLVRMSREPEVKLTRASALMQLARFDRSARGAQMALLTAVGDKEPFVRATAVQSLATWVGDDLVTAKTVLEHLDDPDLRVRYAAYEALRGLSPPPIELLPILEKLILSEDATKSRVGAELAARMGQNAVEAADELWQAHQHHEANQVSMVFVSALASVAPSSAEARNAVAMLIRALEEGTKSRQLRAVELLGAFQVHASDALPALRHAIESEDAALSRAARDALRRIEAGAGEAAVQVVPQV